MTNNSAPTFLPSSPLPPTFSHIKGRPENFIYQLFPQTTHAAIVHKTSRSKTMTRPLQRCCQPSNTPCTEHTRAFNFHQFRNVNRTIAVPPFLAFSLSSGKQRARPRVTKKSLLSPDNSAFTRGKKWSRPAFSSDIGAQKRKTGQTRGQSEI